MNKTAKRSTSYRFTIDMQNHKDHERLAKYREVIKANNKLRKLMGLEPMRVAVKYRLGKNNPFASEYRRGGPRYSYVQTILAIHATRADVYVHENRTYNY